MKALNLKLAGLLSCFLIFPVHAVNKSTVVNETNRPIVVVWTAHGCLHIRYGHRTVCGGLILGPGKKHKYQYNWGATNDHIHAGVYVKKRNEFLVPGAIAARYHTRVKGNCKLPSPDGKVVHITSMTIDEDKLIINCSYEIRSPSSGGSPLFRESECADDSDEGYCSDEGYDPEESDSSEGSCDSNE
ncbi:hypothetical protein [Endozoicomonas sp.]|uniref:hypothetical protein n=1 Tax=Endozoicomonas sp. TaxID=1892382 RepID=UPI00383B6A98